MAFSYSAALTDPKDIVRFLLHDTDKNKAQLDDDEIKFLLRENPNAYEAAAAGAEFLATRFATKANKTVGPLSIDYGKQADAWRQVAEDIRGRRTRRRGGKAITTQTARPPLFTVGMDDNLTDQKLAGALSVPDEQQSYNPYQTDPVP